MKNKKHLFVSVKGHIDDEDFIFIAAVIKETSRLRSGSYILPNDTVVYATPEKCLNYWQGNCITVDYWDIVFDMDIKFEVIDERLIEC